jgi:enoyl-CoA hydratase/carnithine racemase
MDSDMTELVIFSEVASSNGMKIGHATLNKVAALNALNLDMILLLSPQLKKWQQDPKIALVILDGAGDRAFCAGGDVVAMYHAMQETPDKLPASLQEFFTQEYQLDYMIHTYSKPFLVWGNGIVMGGGLGLMSGASHRVVTAKSRIAMPEISIGLYPDVGGSYFLNKTPQGCGLFLGLTGASINAADALYMNLADHFIDHQSKIDFIQKLTETQWLTEDRANHVTLTGVCNDFERDGITQLPQGNVENHQGLITQCTTGESAVQVVEQILQLDAGQDKWLQRAQQTLKTGSPITAHLVFEQLKRGKTLSLAECLQMELVMSCYCGQLGEFQEGVRALMVDKDNQPAWLYTTLADVPEEVIEQFFISPWQLDQHPLKTIVN